ncbi:hypothetical protein CRE_30757 [Caenorhabditis remanei]|uniref:Uncharacterized protein n=1 Tax=Caenorhabditis remanei TaxID=31234 RepID=E3LU41_CAERE|nr:hypothetical protein CRE_30757 [Caenorhabditis remanei]
MADWFKQIAIGFIYGKTIEVTLSCYNIWNGSAQAIGAYIALHFAVRMAMIIENAGFANSVQLIRITRYTMTVIALFCGYQLAAESEKLQREVLKKKINDAENREVRPVDEENGVDIPMERMPVEEVPDQQHLRRRGTHPNIPNP